MKKYSWDGKKGFGVFEESGQWRIAHHVYEETVNGMAAAGTWGIHRDSDEVFVLIRGSAALAVKGAEEDGRMSVFQLEKKQIYMVEAGEPHILILKEDTEVLVIENRNMDNSVKFAAQPEEKEKIETFMKGDIVA
ncbi:hypothetical protein B5F07_11335 [Lachnoclostridium sp. An169]|uniref:hypothetical protein n=1 Tax=Lachnoclostridium sp. An169 TaxID=1965569 RepID=UPI000B373FFC|nr:hypothetical protein [Lachnoclostridium sp. An169]OUP83264.1 hypothetical protein B5F07_11335 [Lachnoclostridium sp. An169]